MLNKVDIQLDSTFAALADPTRRAILERLSAGEATVHELSQPFAISAPAISRHLRVLERAGLIARRIERQHRPCRLEPESLQRATQWLEFYRRFWSESFDQLAEHLAKTAPNLAGSLRGGADNTSQKTQTRRKSDAHRKPKRK
jgi:DNA-binding transcriptional ArsR family regulator